MKIAIPITDGQLSLHFGHCRQFALVDINEADRTVDTTRYLDAPPHQPGLLPRWLADQGATVIIAGGIGHRAQQLFTQHGITVVAGASPAPPEALAAAYLAGTLETGDNACSH